MVCPVSSCAAFSPPSSESSGIRTTTVALSPPAFASSLGRVAGDVLPERPPHSLRGRLALSERAVGGAVFGGREREDRLLERCALDLGEGELPVQPCRRCPPTGSAGTRPGRRAPRVPAGRPGGRPRPRRRWSPAGAGPGSSGSWRRSGLPRRAGGPPPGPAARLGSWSAGRSSTARTMTSACSTCNRPSAKATRVGSWSSRHCRESRDANADLRVVFVWWASQFAVEVAPVWPGTSRVSA